MSRSKLIKDGDGYVWASYDEMDKFRRRRSANIITDTMNETVNPVDGKTYDSKSAYYRAVRAAGCEIVGDESLSKHQSVDRRAAMQSSAADIKASIEQLRSR